MIAYYTNKNFINRVIYNKAKSDIIRESNYIGHSILGDSINLAKWKKRGLVGLVETDCAFYSVISIFFERITNGAKMGYTNN